MQHRRAAIAPLEARRQRLEQPRQDERQRLEAFDRPLEIERRLEPLLRRASGTSGRMSSPRAIACHASAGRPSRATRSADGSAASSPSVLQPPALETRVSRQVTESALPAISAGLECSRDRVTRRAVPGSRSAAAPVPRLPRRRDDRESGRAIASSSAAVRVPATATCTRMPRAGRSRRTPRRSSAAAEQTVEAADVDRHQIVAMAFVTRRKFLRDGDENLQR